MGALSSVLVKFSADIGDLQSKISQAMNQVEAGGKKVQESSSLMGRALEKVGTIAPVVLGAVSGALGGLSAWKGVQFDAEMEQAAISFETLLKSADRAKSMLAELQKLGAETPFEFPELRDSAKLLLAMGMAADKVVPSMRKVGDAVAAIGGNGETLQGVSRALGQMLTKGKVSSEEMAQMAERGLPVWDILAQKLGKSTAEVQKLAEQGKLLATDVVPLLVEGFGDRFGGAMEKQSKTFNGMMSTLADNMNMLLGKAVQPLFAKLSDLLPIAIEFVDRVLKGLEQSGARGALEAIFPKHVVDTIMLLGAAVKETFGFLVDNWGTIEPVLVGIAAGFAAWQVIGIIKNIQQLSTTMTSFNAVMKALNLTFLTNPIVLIVAAIVAAGWLLYRNWDTVSAFLMESWAKVKEVAQAVWSAVADTFTHYGTLIANVVETYLGQVYAIFHAYAGTVIAVVQAWWETLKTIVATVFLAIYYLVTGQWDKIGEVFQAAGERLRAIVSDAVETIKALWGNALGQLWERALSVFREIGGVVDRVMTWVKNLIANGVAAAKDLFVSGFNAVIDWLWGLPGRAGEAIWAVASKITGIIGGIDLWQMGRDLIYGLGNGIASLGRWIADKVTGTISNAVEAAKDFLGIHSPSRLFKEFGKYTVQGFAIGIEDNSGLAEQASLGMAQATASAAEGIVPTMSYRQAFHAQATAERESGPQVGQAGGMSVQIGSLVVREEADIQRIAEQLYRLQQRGLRAKGAM